MKFTRSSIPDVIIIEPELHGDHRGYFMETYRHDKLEAFLGYSVNFIQDNESKSNTGVLRGLHYQLAPSSQTKLVRVIQGSVLDVTVDIRKESKTFGQHMALELSAENRKQLFIPRGFAHGFVVLEENTIFSYKVDNYYSPADDRGIAFDDPALGIDWLINKEQLQVSVKDTKQPMFINADIFTGNSGLYD